MRALGRAATQGAAETGLLLAIEKQSCNMGERQVACAEVVGQALAAGAAAVLSDGTCSEKLQKAASAAGTSLALASAHEAANGIAGAGLVANVAGQAVGAAITSMAHAAQAGGQAALVHGAGKALATAGVPLCPTNLINEEGRKGIEFAGGSMVSIGCRDRVGFAQLEDGSQVRKSQHEEGMQLRVGQGLRSFLFWHVWQTSRFPSSSVHA